MPLLSRIFCPPIFLTWTPGGRVDKKGTLQKPVKCLKSTIYRYFPQQNLYFFPLPHGHGELRSAMVYYLL